VVRYFIGGMAFLIGALSVLQPPINAALAKRGGPYAAVTISFLVGTALLLLATAFTGGLHVDAVRGAPWWQFAGGAVGAVFVFGTVVLVPRLGATGLLAAVAGGQLAGSLVIDHLGMFGLPRVAPTPWRLAGLALLIAGGILMVKR
jgi:transporter family-2 protein